ncbi:inositol monophosphatase [Nocardioides sp. WL0053]|uniref:Inositol-1-monophosphatase n=1 Tax=Nocardioides jiangsuensis TaxID=2866161 RepID=A0ABS7RGF6_9ACTN|nr:inositol monophosphatase family protein [Nocardioides jiangsuensis]MBY9073587.1 inositol monophosphatase [Nocardioides jiangsuensis]
MGHDQDALLDLARAVAVEAAELVRDRRRQGVEVEQTKSSPTDIVTAVDRAAEELIHERLVAARPDDGFLGEEGAARESASGVTWVVDPIDGTVNFLYGLPQYAISIAATVDGETVAGVVLNVVSGECFTATRGGGAWCDGERLAVRAHAPVSERLVFTGFSYERDVRARQAQAVAAMLGRVRDVRRLGSAALDLCFLGAGRTDAYVEEGLNPWDVAAGGLVATEAGARLETRPGVGGKPCVVCAPADGFDEVVALAAECGFFAED